VVVSVEKTARLFDSDTGRMVISGTPWWVQSLHSKRKDAEKRAERLQGLSTEIRIRVAKAALARGRTKWAVVGRSREG